MNKFLMPSLFFSILLTTGGCVSAQQLHSNAAVSCTPEEAITKIDIKELESTGEYPIEIKFQTKENNYLKLGKVLELSGPCAKHITQFSLVSDS